MKRFVAVLLIILSVFLLGCGMQQEVIKKPASVLAHEMYENLKTSYDVADKIKEYGRNSRNPGFRFINWQLAMEIQQYFCDRYNGKEIDVTGCVQFKKFCNDGALMIVLGAENDNFVSAYVTDDNEIKKCVKLKDAFGGNGLSAIASVVGKKSVVDGDYVTMRGKCKVEVCVDSKAFFGIMNAKLIE